jgi:hypothetical protein
MTFLVLLLTVAASGGIAPGGVMLEPPPPLDLPPPQQPGQEAALPPAPAAPPAAPPSVFQKVAVYSLVGGGRVAGFPYKRLSHEERFELYLKDTYTSTGAMLRPALFAAFDYFQNDVPVYDGAHAYGRHLTYRLISQTVQRSVQYGMMAALQHEPRYVPCRCTNVARRVGHAILFNFVTYDQRGAKVLNISRLASGYAGHLAAMSIYPQPYDFWWAMRRGNGRIYFGSTSNILREFAPEVRRLFRMSYKPD